MKKTGKKLARKANSPIVNTKRRKAVQGVPANVHPDHVSMLNDIHPELRKMVNTFLSERNIPFQVHQMHFAPESVGDQKCCVIDGQVVCGPQCF